MREVPPHPHSFVAPRLLWLRTPFALGLTAKASHRPTLLAAYTGSLADVWPYSSAAVGNRLSQTVGITTTRYALDPEAVLTHVLADGTNTYPYGQGRIGQSQTAMQFFWVNGLGSMRQLYDESRQVMATSRYDP